MREGGPLRRPDERVEVFGFQNVADDLEDLLRITNRGDALAVAPVSPPAFSALRACPEWGEGTAPVQNWRPYDLCPYDL